MYDRLTNAHVVGLLVLGVGVALFGVMVMGNADANVPDKAAVSFEPPYPDHLIHYFPNNDEHADASQTTDAINGLNLTFGNNVGLGTGYDGQGIEFQTDKSGIVSFDTAPEIDETTGWTIAFWTNDVGSNGDRLNTVDVFYTRNGLDNTILSWGDRLGYSVQGCGQHIRASPAVGEEWKHVVVTYDGDEATFYLNGVKVHSSSCSGNTNFFASDAQLGWHADAATPDKSMDEITLHDQALTQSEIEELGGGYIWKKIRTKAGTIFLSPPRQPANATLPQ